MNTTGGEAPPYGSVHIPYSAWTRKDPHVSCMNPGHIPCLAPAFWQARGHALGGKHAITTMREVGHDRPTLVTRAAPAGRAHGHRFVEALAAGQSPDAGFAQRET